MGLKIEAFLPNPPGANSIALIRLLEEIEREYGRQVDVITYEGDVDQFEAYNLTATPAVVVEELIKMMGFCPSRESLISALREMGLE
jgi:hypothetical protein